jgi:nucleoside phosphorylase
MGPARAEALSRELDRASPAALWLAGWCGGLRKDLRVGDLVLANATLGHTEAGTGRIDHPPPQALAAWLEAWAEAHECRLAVAPVLTSAHVLARASEKRAAAATGAAAVEMEAAPLARWAAERRVAFFHLRVVLDPAGSDLPPEELHSDGEEEEGLRGTLWRALRRPHTWPAVWRLLGQARRARRTMALLGASLTAPDGPLGAGA